MALKRISPAAKALRQALVTEARFKAGHPRGMVYSEVRPIDYALLEASWPSDCSGSIISFYKKVGAPDPSGNKFDGSGNTVSFVTHLPHIRRGKARRGDIIVFNADKPVQEQHAVMLLQAPSLFRDPEVWSHGGQSGPFIRTLSYEQSGFSGATVFLRGVDPWTK